ncbi:MAG: hypothetical protein MUE41_00105 [Gemmatimonadaceae bacterium]|jgi:hypothetical protein|nr:hypothetical protein [Gemmatimonadaceae bacterium]
MRSALVALLVCATLSACATGAGHPTPTAQPIPSCFPVERLSAEDRRWADRLLLRAVDGEALYTVAGGLKPVSSDGGTLRLRVYPSVDRAALDSLERLQRIAAALTCGDVAASVQLFAATFAERGGDSTRIADLVFVHRARTAALVARHQPFFATLGVTPAMRAEDVVHAVEHAARAPRWRGYGLLFGYPDAAVDFFVRAGIEGDSTKRLVPREFRRIDTWRRYPAASGAEPTLAAFVYAVPAGAAPDSGDRALAAAAEPVYADYRTRRAALGADTSGIVALLRAWGRVGR